MAQWRTSSTRNSIHTGVIGRCYTYSWRTPRCALTFFPLPEGQAVKRLRTPPSKVLKEQRYTFWKEGSQNKMKSWKIPEGQEYAPRLEPAAPIRLADWNHAHYPSRRRTVLKKKTARWRTSSALDSIHTEVIGRCYHVHLKHQIHGANWKYFGVYIYIYTHQNSNWTANKDCSTRRVERSQKQS